MVEQSERFDQGCRILLVHRRSAVLSTKAYKVTTVRSCQKYAMAALFHMLHDTYQF